MIDIEKNWEMFKKYLSDGPRDVSKVIKWAETTDIKTAPASTRFHGNYAGGLVQHSLNVFWRLCQLAYSGVFPQKPPEKQSLAIVALCHDFCKINFYQPSVRPEKVNGAWVDKPCFVIDEKLPLGHGEKSVAILQNLVRMTGQEMLAIRWHMGAFLTAYGPWEVENAWMKRAPEEFPLGVALHMADAIASRFDESADGEEPSAYAYWKHQEEQSVPMESLPEDLFEWISSKCCGLDPNTVNRAFSTLYYFLNRGDPASDRSFGAVQGGLTKYVAYMAHFVRNLSRLLHVDMTDEDVMYCGILTGLGRADKWESQLRNRKNSEGEWEQYTVFVPNMNPCKDAPGYEAAFDGPAGPRGMFWASNLAEKPIDPELMLAMMYVEGCHGSKDIEVIGRIFDNHPKAFLTHLAHLASAFGMNY